MQGRIAVPSNQRASFENRAEGVLSVATALLVLLALALVYGGRHSQAVPGAIDVNRATPEQLAGLLRIDRPLALRLIDYRDRMRGFEGVDQLLDAPLLTDAQAEALADAIRRGTPAGEPEPIARIARVPPSIARRFAAAAQMQRQCGDPDRWIRRIPALDRSHLVPRSLVARDGASAAATFWIGALLLAGAIVLLPAWLRRIGIGGDPLLVPLALLLCGLGVAMLFSIKDPLRDRAVYAHHLAGLTPALICLAASACLGPERRRRLRRYGYVWAMAALLLVVLLFLFGTGPQGVKLNLAHFQPVEVVKVLLVVFLAALLSDRAGLIAAIKEQTDELHAAA